MVIWFSIEVRGQVLIRRGESHFLFIVSYFLEPPFVDIVVVGGSCVSEC